MSQNYNRNLSPDSKINRLNSFDFRLKAIEVSLTSLCLGLGLDAFMNGAVPQWPGVGLCCILTGAYVIITGVTLGCSFFANPLPKSLSVSLSAVGGVVFAATAASVMRGWEQASGSAAALAGSAQYVTGLRQMWAQSMLALAAAIAFLVDAAHEGVVGPWLRDAPVPAQQYYPSRVSTAVPPPPLPLSLPPPHPLRTGASKTPLGAWGASLGQAVANTSRLPPAAAAAAARRLQRKAMLQDTPKRPSVERRKYGGVRGGFYGPMDTVGDF